MSVGSGSSSRSIFSRRWMDHIRKQYGVIRSVVDITVALYILIPGILLLGMLYYDLLKSPPIWLAQVPFVCIPILLLLVLSRTGGIILYREPADVLFLRQNKRWQLSILRLGCTVSLAFQVLVLGVMVLILSPVLLQIFKIQPLDVLLLFGVTAAYHAAQLLLLHFIEVLMSGWRRAVVKYLAALIMAAGYVGASAELLRAPLLTLTAAAAFTVAAAILMIVRLRLRGTFMADVRSDQKQMTRLTALILSAAVDKPRSQKPKPYLFKKSNKLFRSRNATMRIAENLVKSYYRNGVNLKLYAQFTLFGVAACLLPPYPMNIMVYLVLIILLSYWMSGYCAYFFTSRYMSMLPLPEGTSALASVPALRLLMLPCVLILSMGLGIKLFHAWWAVPLFLLIGFVVTWWIWARVWMLFVTRRAMVGKKSTPV